jgi:hypothetical protein
VGTAGTIVKEAMLFPPPGFPCVGANGACAMGAGTHELHTEVRSLRMTPLSPPGNAPAVRAGVWYNSPLAKMVPPARISPGEIEAHAGPNPGPDLPASSFFDIFVQVDLPACGGFPGGILYNSVPLIVKNMNLPAIPPKVVYLRGQFAFRYGLHRGRNLAISGLTEHHRSLRQRLWLRAWAARSQRRCGAPSLRLPFP